MRPSYSRCTIRILHDLRYRFSNINFLLTERKCTTEEFWLDLLTVQTEHSEVFTVNKEGQYSQVRLEQAGGWRISLVVYFMALRPNLLILNLLPFAT